MFWLWGRAQLQLGRKSLGWTPHLSAEGRSEGVAETTELLSSSMATMIALCKRLRPRSEGKFSAIFRDVLNKVCSSDISVGIERECLTGRRQFCRFGYRLSLGLRQSGTRLRRCFYGPTEVGSFCGAST